MAMQKIIQGGKFEIIVRIMKKVNDIIGDPVDLTNMTEISVCFPKIDGTEFTAKLSTHEIEVVGSPLLGKIKIKGTAAVSATLLETDESLMEITLTEGSADPVKVQIPRAYFVVRSEC
jgi:hypothetical protein